MRTKHECRHRMMYDSGKCKILALIFCMIHYVNAMPISRRFILQDSSCIVSTTFGIATDFNLDIFGKKSYFGNRAQSPIADTMGRSRTVLSKILVWILECYCNPSTEELSIWSILGTHYDPSKWDTS
jgi:hypothetical protein